MRGDRQRCEKCGRYVSVLNDMTDHYARDCPAVDAAT